MQKTLDDELADYRLEQEYAPAGPASEIIKMWYMFRSRHAAPATHNDIDILTRLYNVKFTPQDISAFFLLDRTFYYD